MTKTPTIIFVCEHGAAKSIVAAAYFNKLAGQMGLDLKAVARGTHPDLELTQAAVEGLLEDGLGPTESTPQKLLPAEAESARKVIAFCELPESYRQKVELEQWEGVAAVSENYQAARDAMLERLNLLIADLYGSIRA